MKAQITNLERNCAKTTSHLDSSSSTFAAHSAAAAASSPTTEVGAGTGSASPAFIAETPAAAPLITNSAATSSFAAAAATPAPEVVASAGITREALSDALESAIPFAKKAANGRFKGQAGRSAENRIKSNHDRKRNVIIGKKPSSGVMSFVGVPLTVDCYVGRVGLQATSEQVVNEITSNGVEVVSIEENATRHQLFKSFKIVIKKADFETLNQPGVWPEGIIFRRFQRPRTPHTGQDDHLNTDS